MIKQLMKVTTFFIAILMLISCKSTGKQTATSDMSMLSNLTSPILLQGNNRMAYRDPLILHEDGKFWLFYSIATNQTDTVIQGEAFWQTAYSTSTDLKQWSKPIAITPQDLTLNFCSPGSITKHDGEWVMSLQSYPTPNGEKFGNDSSRLWITRSTDLSHWSDLEMIYFMGSDVPNGSIPRMIDPCIIPDKDIPGKWWCFCKIKQTGVSMAWSNDLKSWNYEGRIDGGENPCVIVQDNKYVLFHSPSNGIGIKQSENLHDWQDTGLLLLNQQHWDWAQGRLTAGYVLDARDLPSVGHYLMVFHGEKDNNSFTVNSSIGIAWSKDLENWQWP